MENFLRFSDFVNESEINEKNHPMLGGTVHTEGKDYYIEEVEPHHGFDVYISGDKKFMSTKVKATPPDKNAIEKFKKIRGGGSSSWNQTSYNKWIKSMADNSYGESFEMAQNARYEPGLIDYVSKQIYKNGGDEKPLERIQWDIEKKIR
jgi:hypothetical protein